MGKLPESLVFLVRMGAHRCKCEAFILLAGAAAGVAAASGAVWALSLRVGDKLLDRVEPYRGWR